MDETGTRECHILLESKKNIEKILFMLDGIDNEEVISCQLKSIYMQLDGMHELKKIRKQSKY
tara:strand:- start:2469 stop:2654 length:186 start_codon:yes stop_codon:yes gene_type:complete